MQMTKTIALVTVTLLSRVVVSPIPPTSSENNDIEHDLPKPYSWRKSFSNPGVDRISLGCLLFSNLGCDAECYVVTSVYKLLVTGICDIDHICVCTFAMDTTLDSIWLQNFALKDDSPTLQQIKDDVRLANRVREIFYDPFQTGTQIKQKLQNSLPRLQFDKLEVINTSSAASKITYIRGHPDLNDIDTYIDEKLSEAIESSFLKLWYFDYEYTLKKILKDGKRDENRLQRIVNQVRRIGNKSLNSILDKSKYRHIRYNSENTHDIDVIIDKVVDKMINKIDEKVFKKWALWVGNTITFWAFVTPVDFRFDFSTDTQDTLVDKNELKLPREVYKGVLQRAVELVSFGVDVHGYEYKLRYRKYDSNTVNLNWINRSIWVCILKNSFRTISQIWKFGSVTINLVATSDNHMTQYWDFGAYNYQYQDYRDARGHGFHKKKWSDNRLREDKLNKFKQLMDEWCKENKDLIDMDTCTVYKKEK